MLFFVGNIHHFRQISKILSVTKKKFDNDNDSNSNKSNFSKAIQCIEKHFNWKIDIEASLYSLSVEIEKNKKMHFGN